MSEFYISKLPPGADPSKTPTPIDKQEGTTHGHKVSPGPPDETTRVATETFSQDQEVKEPKSLKERVITWLKGVFFDKAINLADGVFMGRFGYQFAPNTRAVIAQIKESDDIQEHEKIILINIAKETFQSGKVKEPSIDSFLALSPKQRTNALEYLSSAPDLLFDPDFKLDDVFFETSITDRYGKEWDSFAEVPLNVQLKGDPEVQHLQVADERTERKDWNQGEKQEFIKELEKKETSSSPHIATGVLNNYGLKEAEKNHKDAATFCDAILVQQFKDGSGNPFRLVVNTDGNGGGLRSQKAAQKAVEGAQKFLMERLQNPKTAPKTAGDLAKLLHLAAQNANNTIHSAKKKTPEEKMFGHGSTTIEIGLNFKDSKGNTHFLVETIGDTQGTILTNSNVKQVQMQAQSKDLSDPGGSIGARTKAEKADVTNLSCHHTVVEDNTPWMYIFGSDGLYDNCSPEQLKVSTKDVGFNEKIPWQKVKTGVYNEVAEHFKNRRLLEMMIEMKKQDKTITSESLVEHIKETIDKQTEVHRKEKAELSKNEYYEAREKNPDIKGKMDHVTCGIIFSEEEVTDDMLQTWVENMNKQGKALENSVKETYPGYEYPKLTMA